MSIDNLHTRESHYQRFCTQSRCLKITEKVSISIASNATFVYILSGQKLIKRQNWSILHIDEFLKNRSLRPNGVIRNVNFNYQDKNCWKMPKLKTSDATFWVFFKHFAYIRESHMTPDLYPITGFKNQLKLSFPIFQFSIFLKTRQIDYFLEFYSL